MLISRILRTLRRSKTVPPKTLLIIPSTVKLEEENIPGYQAKHFYPVRVGQTFLGKYLVLGKLGYGTHSTVWLANDRSKFLRTKYADSTAANHEVDISRCIATADASHKGFRYVRLLLDSFEIDGPDGKHNCLVQELLREPLWLLQQRLPDHDFSSDGIKSLTKILLLGLDYLHTKCHIIHTDLKSDNVMVKFENESVIADYVKADAKEPSQGKQDGDRIIYLSRNNFGHPKSSPGAPKIADFGLAVWGNTADLRHHPIQPDCFRAPEVTLAAGWTYSADVWNLGLLVWELLERRMLFCSGQKVYDARTHVAEMVALLGPPPKTLLDQGTETTQFFNAKGQFQYPELIPGHFNFEALETCLKGNDKTRFIEFMRRMLCWLPQERQSAAELYNNPWLHTPAST